MAIDVTDHPIEGAPARRREPGRPRHDPAAAGVSR